MNPGPNISSTQNTVPVLANTNASGVPVSYTANNQTLSLAILSTDANGNVNGIVNPNGGTISIPLVHNYFPVNYPKTRKLIANIRAGISGSTLPIMACGDSTTEGFAASSGVTNCIQNAWPRRLVDILTGYGIKSGWQNVMGNHNTDLQSSSIQVADPRVSAFPAGWALSSFTGIGGISFVNNSNTNALTFTPTVQTDSLDVYYLDNASNGGITVLSGAGGVTATTGGTIAGGGANGLKKATATIALGSNVWTIQKTVADGKNILIQGFVAYNSATPEVQILNCGRGSQQVSAFTVAGNFWDPLTSIIAVGSGLTPALAIIDLGINDYIQATSIATTTSNLITLVSSYQSAGIECLLVVPVPTSIGTATALSQSNVRQAIISVANTYNCAYVDFVERWKDFTTSNAYGYYNDSVTHPSAMGHVDKAMALSNFFIAL